MTSIYDDGQATLYAGDSLAVLRTLPSESVHVCMTSPPYYALRSYLPDKHPDKPRELGLEETHEAYIARLVEVFQEVRRILHPSGTLWVNIGDSYAVSSGSGPQGVTGRRATRSFTASGLPSRLGAESKPKDLLGIPWMLAFALRADGWWLRSDIIWAKTAPMPESVTDRPTSAHEHVFLFAKQARYFYDAEAVKEKAAVESAGRYRYAFSGNKSGIERDLHGSPDGVKDFDGSRNQRNVWTLGPDPFPGAHFATFPREVPRRAILAGTSERGVCAACGAPWERVVERMSDHRRAYATVGAGAKAAALGKRNPANKVLREDGRGGDLARQAIRTIDWRPTCSCSAPTVPAVVLDPFVGSGRTLAVAKSLGRRGIGIDLNETYLREFAVPACQQLAMLDLEAV